MNRFTQLLQFAYLCPSFARAPDCHVARLAQLVATLLSSASWFSPKLASEVTRQYSPTAVAPMPLGATMAADVALAPRVGSEMLDASSVTLFSASQASAALSAGAGAGAGAGAAGLGAGRRLRRSRRRRNSPVARRAKGREAGCGCDAGRERGSAGMCRPLNVSDRDAAPLVVLHHLDDRDAS